MKRSYGGKGEASAGGRNRGWGATPGELEAAVYEAKTYNPTKKECPKKAKRNTNVEKKQTGQ